MIQPFWRKIRIRSTSYSAEGDAARGRTDWKNAERFYRQHLNERDQDCAIWVQLGHALKEQAKLAEAAQAYKRALDLDPSDDDCRTHYAHLLKRRGDTGDAVKLFVQLFERTGQREACHELTLLGELNAINDATVQRRRTLVGDAVFVELDDLLGFLEAHKTVTGIQRVQIGVIQYITGLAQRTLDYVFVLNEPDSTYVWKMREGDITAIVNCLQQSAVDHGELKELVATARQSAEAVLPRAGHAYIVLGAFWGYGAVASRYASMKRSGVMVGAYVYDLIPITHTQYCDEGLPHEFTLSLGDGLAVFDFVLAISEYSAREVKRFITGLGLRSIPVIAVPLAHSDWTPPATRPVAALTAIEANRSPSMVTRTSPLSRLRGRPFAMMVSTIEARKNHGYLVAAWQQFIDEGLTPPDLVFVGRPGWRVTSLMEMLKTTRYLDHRVHIFNDLSDHDLNDLYDHSLFTLFPSFVEGWGLPVGESLARGKPCIASNTASIPEVGGDLVDYVDPLNLRHGIEVIRRMAFDAVYRASREQEIRARFKPRTWRDVGADLLRHVEELRTTASVNTKPEVLFPSGEIFWVGSLALGKQLSRTYAVHPLRSVLVTGWYGIENVGCWMKGNSGEILFRSDLPPHTSVVLHLGFYAVHFASRKLLLTIQVGDGAVEVGDQASVSKGDELTESPTTMRVPINTHFNAIAAGRVDAFGLVRIHIKLTGVVTHETPDLRSRRFAIGLGHLAYTASDDQEARTALAERLLLGSHFDDCDRSLHSLLDDEDDATDAQEKGRG